MDNTKSEKQDVVRGRGKWRYIVVVATVLLIFPHRCIGHTQYKVKEENPDFPEPVPTQIISYKEEQKMVQGTTLVPNLVLGFSRGEHDLFFERTSQGEPLMIFNGSDMAIWVKKDGMTKVCLYNYISALSYGLAGLWVPILLTKLDYSEISIVGCVIFLTGAALRIGINDFVKLCMCVGVLENVAIGLIMHASLIALNSNFTRKIALMTFLHETGVCVLGLFIYHIVSQMKGSPFFGVNPSILGIASIVLSFIAVFLLRTKKIIKDIRSVRPKNANANDGDCLIRNQIARNVSKGLGKGLTLWNNYRYWNTIIGISLVVNADEYFFKALPILNPMVYQSFFLEEEWYFKIAYFSVTELIFRIILTLIFVLGAVKGRLVILSFCTLVVYGRTAPFIFDTKTVNTKIQLVVFEGLKCFTQVPVSLVFFDAYKNNFTSAYSGYMVMYSVVNFIFTGLLHLVSHLSDSLKTMEYICIAAYAICVIIWTLEFTVFRKKPITNGQNLNEINKA